MPVPTARPAHRRTVSPARDELLRQQRAVTGRAFNRPQPRFERCRPAQQPVALSTIGRTDSSPTSCSSRSITAAVCDPLCGSIPMMNTKSSSHQKWNAAAGTPDAGMPFLFRATPQHGNRRDGLIARKPTRRRQGILETNPPAPSTLRTQPQRVTRTQPSGQSVRRLDLAARVVRHTRNGRPKGGRRARSPFQFYAIAVWLWVSGL